MLCKKLILYAEKVSQDSQFLPIFVKVRYLEKKFKTKISNVIVIFFIGVYIPSFLIFWPLKMHVRRQCPLGKSFFNF